VSTITPVTGLTDAQVAERVARGEFNDAPDAHSRSLASIIRSNTFTYFNALIGSMWIIMLLVAPIQDSLFGFVIVANTLIGITQEYRASRTLAKLSVIGEAKITVRRNGTDVEVRPREVVLDDLILISTGEQLVVDGEVITSDGLEIDESLLTGEADPVDKSIGDTAMSGSFVVAGSGMYRATRVGKNSFAAGLTEQARKFALTRSELRESINTLIRIASFLLVPVGLLLLWSQLQADQPVNDAIRGTIAGVVTMVPEGLVLLTSIAMAVSVIRLAGKKVLVQELPAVEVLARVDTVCVDKTGTLTQPGMQVRDVVVLDHDAPISDILGALGSAEESPNPTLQAVAAAYAKPTGWDATHVVPFSSARKWSAASFDGDGRDGHGTYLLGAPEVLLGDTHADVVREAEELAAKGSRVLLVGASMGEQRPDAEKGAGAVSPLALVVIDQALRPDAADTVSYFLDQNVKIKVISGDNAATVGAIAARAGIPGSDHPVDARDLPDDAADLAEPMDANSVFGRVTPTQKQSMVDALHLRDRTVAMTGDGVNDVLALKNADLGIAMGSGSGATRAVAQIVLLDNKFSVMPSVVAEGRRVLGNIERVADVFVTKTFYASVTSLVIGLSAVVAVLLGTEALEFPFLPRHYTLVSALTIGIPGFFLALMPNTERFRKGFLKRVLLFTIPAGIIAAGTSLASYLIELSNGSTIEDARTAATVTLFFVAAAVLLQSARPLNPLRIGIVLLMIAIFILMFAVPVAANFFLLTIPLGPGLTASVVLGLVGVVLVWAATVITDRWRRP
jgi:cation-transporting P-type ATPase E